MTNETPSQHGSPDDYFRGNEAEGLSTQIDSILGRMLDTVRQKPAPETPGKVALWKIVEATLHTGQQELSEAINALHMEIAYAEHQAEHGPLPFNKEEEEQ